MKKLVKFSILILMLLVGTKVRACEFDYEKFQDLGISHGYVVGNYVFDLDHGYSPNLEDFAIAARSIDDDVYVYEFMLDDDYFSYEEIFGGFFSEDPQDFPKLDLLYNYRAHIRGALENDYDIFNCSINEITLEFTGLLTEGAEEYKTSATRFITIDSDYETTAKYCLTAGELCEPNLSVSVNDDVIEINYPTALNGQRVCVQAFDAKGSSSEIICDANLVKVDREYPIITANDKITKISEGQPLSVEELFDVQYSVSQGKTFYYYDAGENQYLINNLYDLEEGMHTIIALARGGNGLVTTSRKQIEIGRYIVSYNYEHNGGSSVTKDEEQVIYKSYANLDVIARKDGYEFVGWNPDPDAHEGISRLQITDDTTLYAIFKKQLTATFNIYTLGAITAVSEYPLRTCEVYNNDIGCSINVPVLSAKAQYIALGWSDEEGSTEPNIFDSTIFLTENKDYYSVTRRQLVIEGIFYLIKDGNLVTERKSCYQFNGASTCEIEAPITSENYLDTEFIGFTKDTINPSSVTDFNQANTEYYHAYYEDEYQIDYISGIDATTETDFAHAFYIVNDKNVSSIVEEKEAKESILIEGYNRIGWRLDTQALESEINIGQSLNLDSDITLYGVYERSVVLNYVSDEDTLYIPESVEKIGYYNSYSREKSDVEFTLDDGKKIKKTNYLFANWKDEDNIYAPGSLLVTKENKTLTAEWVENGYIITYDYSHNGGISADRTSEVYLVESNTPIDVSSNMAYKTGWRFVGWSTNPNAVGNIERSFKPVADTTLYAIFEKTVQIRYDIQNSRSLSLSGTSTASCTIYNNNTSCQVIVPGVEIIDDEYEFIGWNRERNAKESEYATEGTISVSNNATIYAISRNKNPLTATYIYYEEEERKESEVICHIYNNDDSCDSDLGLEEITYNEGILKGFSLNQEVVELVDHYEISEDTTFYGVYDKIVSLSFVSGEEGSVLVNRTQAINYLSNDEGINVVGTKINLDTPDGIAMFIVSGWRNDLLNEEATYQSGEEFIVTQDEEFYGIYSKTVELSYNVQGSQVTIPSEIKNIYYNAGTKTPSSEETVEFVLHPRIDRQGYYFVNWKKNGLDGEEYEAESTITINVNTTMFANWTYASFKVTYDYYTNGGTSVTEEEKQVYYTEPVDLEVVAYKDGYEFVGWNIEPTANRALEEYNMPDEDIILYAIYRKQIDVNWILLDPLAGEVEEEVTTCYIYNNESECLIKTGNIIENEGYSLAGWTEEQGSIEIQLGSNSYTYVNENKTYYSITRKITPLRAIFHYYNDEIVTVENVCFLYNGNDSCEVEELIVPNLGKDGSTFISWKRSDDTEDNKFIINQDTEYKGYYENIIRILYYEGFDDIEGSTIQTGVITYLVSADEVIEENPTLTLKTPESIPDFTALGWREDTEPDINIYEAETTLTIDDSIDLYAVYSRDLTLTYDGNGAEYSNTQTITQYYNSSGNYSSNEVVLAEAPEREGYTFIAWALDSIDGQHFAPGDTITLTQNATMYAIWLRNRTEIINEPLLFEDGCILYEQGDDDYLGGTCFEEADNSVIADAKFEIDTDEYSIIEIDVSDLQLSSAGTNYCGGENCEFHFNVNIGDIQITIYKWIVFPNSNTLPSGSEYLSWDVNSGIIRINLNDIGVKNTGVQMISFDINREVVTTHWHFKANINSIAFDNEKNTL